MSRGILSSTQVSPAIVTIDSKEIATQNSSKVAQFASFISDSLSKVAVATKLAAVQVCPSMSRFERLKQKVKALATSLISTARAHPKTTAAVVSGTAILATAGLKRRYDQTQRTLFLNRFAGIGKMARCEYEHAKYMEGVQLTPAPLAKRAVKWVKELGFDLVQGQIDFLNIMGEMFHYYCPKPW